MYKYILVCVLYNIKGIPHFSNSKEKTILLVGATGSGKSTLVDGIINYVTGVNWKDPYRFTLVDLEEEEKNKNQVCRFSTLYTFHKEGTLYLACNDKIAFFTSDDQNGLNVGIVKRFVTL